MISLTIRLIRFLITHPALALILGDDRGEGGQFGDLMPGRLRVGGRRRTARLGVEALEDRLTPAPVIKWDTPYDFDVSKTYALRRVVEARLNWLRAGEQVRVEASLNAGEEPPGPTVMGVGRSSPGDLFTIDSHGTQTRVFRASGPGETVKVQIDNYDMDDFAHLKVQVRKRSNLAVIGPTIHPDGRLTYGYAIPSDTSPDWNGANVRIGLYYRYIQGGKVKMQWIAGSELSDQPGYRKEFELQIKNLPSPPTGTTEIVAAIDIDDKVPETNEGDNQRSIKLPNLSVEGPGYRERALFGGRYLVSGTIPPVADSANSLRAELYYAKGDKLTDILGAPIAGGAVTATGGIILTDPPTPPVGTTHVLYVIDRYNRVAETDETDNVRATLLPDLDITGLEWDGKGGAVIKVKVANAAALPFGVNPGVGLYWATGPAATDKVLLSTITLPRASITRKDGEYTIPFKPGTLPTVDATFREGSGFLSAVTHLVAEVFSTSPIYEANEANNSTSVALGQVSDELSNAPPAATGAERVRLWMRKHEGLIRTQAVKQNVDPRTVAGIIAWEALYNNKPGTPAASPVIGYGPGKVHWHNATKWFGQTLPDFLGRGVAEEVEDLGLVSKSHSNGIDRAKYLRTTGGAIEYIAAILRGYSDVLRKHGYDPTTDRSGPGVLATLYWGVGIDRDTIAEYDAWLTANPGHLPTPASNPHGMGGFVDQNTGTATRPRYVDSLLSFTYKPRDRSKPLPRPKADSGTTRRTSPIQFNVLANDSAELSQTLALAGFTQPLHGSLTRVGNGLVYKPSGSHVGEDSFYYTLRDAEGVIAGATVRIDVRDTGPANLRVVSSRQTSVDLRWDDGSISEIRYVIERSVDGGRTWQHAENVPADRTTATLDGLRPDTEYQFRVKADTPRGPTDPTAPVPARTLAANRPVNAVPDAVTVRPGQEGRIAVLANDSDPDGDAIALVSFDARTARGSVRRDGDALVFIPDDKFAGSESFRYTVGDHHGGRATATVTVHFANQLPVARDDRYDAHTGRDIAFEATLNDSDPDGDGLRIRRFDAVTARGGRVWRHPGDDREVVLFYRSPDNFTGRDWFTYTVGDGFGGTREATVSIEVGNQAPVAAADPRVFTRRNTPVRIDVLANDSDPDGDALVAHVENGPRHGNLRRDGNSFVYEPERGFTGQDSFDYYAGDHNGGRSNVVRVRIQVGNVPGPRPVHDHQHTDYNGDGVGDLVFVQKAGTGSGTTEVHVLDGASNFQAYSLHTDTALHMTGDEWELQSMDFNNDGHLDLVGIKKSGTGSGKVEVHVLDGATNYETWLVQTPTWFSPVGANGRFSLVDMNRDGVRDLVLILKSGTGSHTTEVHAFDGRNLGDGHFRRAIVQTGTALHETGGEGDLELGDYNNDGFVDLWYVKKYATGSGHTEVHVFSGADNFRTHLLAVATALHQTGDEAEFELSDLDRDGRLDLYFVKKDLAGANPVELHVLSAVSNFQTFILQVGTGLVGGRDGTFGA